MSDDIDAFSRAIVKHGISNADNNNVPADAFSRALVKRAIQTLPKEEIPVTSGGEPKETTDWNGFKHATDEMLNGAITREDPKEARAKALWANEHPEQATSAMVIGRTVLPTAMATGIGKFLRVGTEMFGAPAVGEALTGGGENFIIRALTGAASGAWQGALPGLIYPDEGQNVGLNMLTGAAIGGATGGLMSPLRSSISPEVAQAARAYMKQGIPLKTSQIPGAPATAKIMAKVLGMGEPDIGALTKRVIASTGSTGELLNHDTIEAAKDAIGQRLNSAASGTGRLDDRQFYQDILNTAHLANSGLAGQDAPRKQMMAMLGQIHDAALNGKLNGDVYQNLTQKGSALSNALDRTSPIRQYAVPVRDALDSALQRANPAAADDISLARNQYRNAILAEGLENEQTGVVDPKKLYSLVKNNYGSMGSASDSAANAQNPVDIGVLAGGGKFFNNAPHGPGPFATAGIVGGTTAAAIGGEHFGLPIAETLGEHPGAALATGVLGSLYGAGGILQNTTLGRNLLLSGGPGFIANPLIPSVAAARSAQTPPSPDNAETEAYIRQAARARGIDPDVAVKVAKSEGLGTSYEGDEGSSFGPFQLHYGGMPGVSKGNQVGGLGDVFTKSTGLHASDPSTTRAQIDFALDYAAKNGWTPWHGFKGDSMAGIPSASSDSGGSSPWGPIPSSPSNVITIPMNPANVQANPLTGGP